MSFMAVALRFSLWLDIAIILEIQISGARKQRGCIDAVEPAFIVQEGGSKG